MTEEEKIKRQLEEKFAYLKDAVLIKRKGRLFAELSLGQCDEVFDYAVKQMRFSALSAITGLDRGDAFAVMYHLNRGGTIIFSITVGLNKDNPAVKTVTPYFPSADIYERELMDLFGIKIEGLASGDRYPLPDNWPKGEHPLRKDWKGSTYQKEVQNA